MLLLVLLSWLLLSSSQLQLYLPNPPKHLELASAYIGVKERGENRGKEIYTWQKFVGIPQGYPYCAAFVSWVNYNSGITYPKIKSALARNFVTKKSINAKDVYKGTVTLKPGTYIVVWAHGSTPRGHVGYQIVQLDRETIMTLEANTTLPGGREGVGIRKRKINPYSYFRITHFTPIEYRQGV